MMMNHLPLYLATLVLSVGCLRPAEERAERDLTVGHSTNSAGSVLVRDGLAAVRVHTAERIVLWQAAPTIDVSISPQARAPFELEVRNSMRHGRVTVFEGNAAVDLVDGAGTKNIRLRVTPGGNAPIGIRVSPPEPETESFRFALMSDVQEAIDEVQDLYSRINAEPGLDFLLGAGDLTQRGTNRQLLRFENELEGLELPYYTTLGNHELGVSPPLYHDYFGRGSFSFEHRNVRFTLLDTASATVDPLVYEWLDEWLAAGKDQLHILAMHVPPIDPIGVRNGSFASRLEAHKLLQRFIQGGVDLTLYGHVHSFYDFSNADIPAVISGGGGAIPERFDDVGRHFVVFDVNPRRGTFSKNLVAIEPD